MTFYQMLLTHFLKKDVVLVTEKGQTVNLLTNIDILNFIAKRENM